MSSSEYAGTVPRVLAGRLSGAGPEDSDATMTVTGPPDGSR